MLTQKQMNMAQIWVDNPNISMEELKDRAGVSQKTCYMYRQNEEFQEYVHQLCAQKFKDMEKVAMKKLYGIGYIIDIHLILVGTFRRWFNEGGTKQLF